MMKRLLTVCIALAVVAVGFSLSPKLAEAATVPLNGYAWAETAGWIHFCIDNPCTGSSSYKVLVDTSDGAMSGFAWSENFGWLSFDVADTASCGSAANLNSGVMDGWAKWLASGECVHLKGSGYGVTYSSQSSEFSGFAWGDGNTGWMQWRDNSPNYGVYSEGPIVAPPTPAPNGLTATAVSTTRIDLAWTQLTQNETGFQIERKTGVGDFALINTTVPNSTSFQNTGLAAGTNYTYRVRAVNNGGASSYTNESSTSTLPLTATIDITVNPTSASWTLNKDGQTIASGTGNRTDLVVYPTGSPSSFSIVGGSLSGYDFPPAYTNTQGSGSAMGLFGNENVGFTLTYAVSFNYSMSNDGNESVQKGGIDQYGEVWITKTKTAGTAQAVSIDVSGYPTGVTPQYDGNRDCAPNSSCQTKVTFVVSPNATAGTYPITVTGSPLGKTTGFNLVITNSPNMAISCTHDAGPFDVSEEVTWTANIDNPGAGGPYTFRWEGTTIPLAQQDYLTGTQSFGNTYTTTGTKVVTAHVKDRLSNTATCPQASVTIGVNPTFEEF